MYREQKVLIAKVITRKTLLGVSQIPYCTQSSFSACINECVSGSMGHRRLSYITEEASQIVANVGWLGKLRPTSIRENGYLLSVPTRHTEQRGFIIHIAMPFIFSAIGICGLLPHLQTSGPGLSPEVTKLKGLKSVTVEMLGSISAALLSLSYTIFFELVDFFVYLPFESCNG